MNTPTFERRFTLTATLTLVAVYILILVGGIVRSTGSGMGCPDWPKCFGQWVPPTHINELPPNYKEVYTAQRVAKNERVANTLKSLGFTEVAANIFAHPNQYIETDFNPVKTWIEYLNRLTGVIIGFLILLTVVVAWPYRRSDPLIFWASFLSFITVGVQGWLGSLVVSTNLLPVMVTIHMSLALVLVALLIWAIVRAGSTPQMPFLQQLPSGLSALLFGLTALTFLQIVLGTQVREDIDMVAFGLNYLHRDQWIAQLGGVFRFHRTFSAVLLIGNVYAAIKLFQTGVSMLNKLAYATLAVLLLEIVAGITLAYFAMPAAAQPIHLTLGTLLFGVQFLAFVQYRKLTQLSQPVEHPAVVA
ncbi:COX15/CtaA family protein [Solirubrum puertoriconensis]|uniref:Cytochrome oxidase assembly protein n=1 Tax=Solirubrum puertoriconensis TaxID=1751427 RepID=A0A9X0HJ40_SOLP1|nr:COX15/CtaA family protein [Solirubrum puertoriconensis]KUG06825.1 cytochrome oxidase assembly protein [Solirubrum puertoriconensis]